MGFWTKKEIADRWKVESSFNPKLNEQKREELYSGWKKSCQESDGLGI